MFYYGDKKITPEEAEEKIEELMEVYMNKGISELKARLLAVSELRREYTW